MNIGIKMMNQWSRKNILKELVKIVPEIDFIKKSEEFDGTKDGIWIAGENAWCYKGVPPFLHEFKTVDVMLGDGTVIRSLYVNGVHREIHYWLEERGWYPKWYDAGTLFFWKYNIKGFGV